MKNYYRYSEGLPYHLSVGAAIVNDHDEVLCHHYRSITVDGKAYRDFYILMRETLEPGETPEEALQRGCEQEMGASVEVEDYLGPIVAPFHEAGLSVEKTTLYFKCRLIERDDKRRDPNDPESGSAVGWQPIHDMINTMSEQGQRLGRQDLDESTVLKRLLAEIH